MHLAEPAGLKSEDGWSRVSFAATWSWSSGAGKSSCDGTCRKTGFGTRLCHRRTGQRAPACCDSTGPRQKSGVSAEVESQDGCRFRPAKGLHQVRRAVPFERATLTGCGRKEQGAGVRSRVGPGMADNEGDVFELGCAGNLASKHREWKAHLAGAVDALVPAADRLGGDARRKREQQCVENTCKPMSLGAATSDNVYTALRQYRQLRGIAAPVSMSTLCKLVC